MATPRDKVVKRARGKCEYCLAPQSVTGYAFHVEHIRPRSQQGKDALSNFALACANCNFSKSNHLTGEDPATGRQEPLFNPRKDDWGKHFKFSKTTGMITGKTASGRATEGRLRLNDAKQLEARALWIELGIYP
jgi:hypothetical protein